MCSRTFKAYGLSKLALHAAAARMSRQWTGVAMHAINPGAVDSEIWRDLGNEPTISERFIAPLVAIGRRWLFLDAGAAAVPVVAAATEPSLAPAPDGSAHSYVSSYAIDAFGPISAKYLGPVIDALGPRARDGWAVGGPSPDAIDPALGDWLVKTTGEVLKGLKVDASSARSVEDTAGRGARRRRSSPARRQG